MAYVLLLFEILTALFGGAWVAQVFSYPRGATSYETLGTAIAAAPGIAVLVGGLLIIAAGEALVRLANIDRNSASTARATRELVTAVKPSEQ